MQDAFGGLPDSLRNELLKAFNEIVRNYRERRWEPSELNGGKLCEVVYTILKGHAEGSFPAKASKPRNMLAACHALEQAPLTAASRSVRVQIPRMIVALYEIRNNRGVGHVGGDVDPNAMDASAVLAMAKWILAELIRVFHAIDTAEAEAAVERLVERTVPFTWELEDTIRILHPGLSMTDKALLVLHRRQGWVLEKTLLRDVEHSHATVFRRDILTPLHRRRFVEYDVPRRRLLISPRGIDHVERVLVPALTEQERAGTPPT
jgi:hypothetical protein